MWIRKITSWIRHFATLWSPLTKYNMDTIDRIISDSSNQSSSNNRMELLSSLTLCSLQKSESLYREGKKSFTIFVFTLSYLTSWLGLCVSARAEGWRQDFEEPLRLCWKPLVQMALAFWKVELCAPFDDVVRSLQVSFVLPTWLAPWQNKFL